MKWKVIKTEEEYDKAMERFDKIFQAKKGTPEGEELDLLADIIEKYDKEHYPVSPPDPIEALKFAMENLNIKQKDLIDVFGYKERVSEILSGKRKLTLDMIRKLHKKLNIHAETLIAEY